MMTDDVSMRLIDIINAIKPPLPNGTPDYSAADKVAMYDRASAILYDTSGMVRPLDHRAYVARPVLSVYRGGRSLT